jgi:hypothetical protein
MNILIVCHQHPDIEKKHNGEHVNLTISNANHTYRNKTRKNKNTNANSKYFKLHYIDTDPEISNTAPATFFKSWDKVPKGSMDILWGQYCPAYFPFNRNETMKRITGDGHPVGKLLTHEGTRTIWTNLLEFGKKVLKPGGKIVIPFVYMEQLFRDETNLLLITRILNMECFPEHLYKVDVVLPDSDGHKEVLDNLMIYGKEAGEPKPIRLLVLSL